MSISALEALARLKEGNQRFVNGAPRMSIKRLPSASYEDQTPIAVVLGCSDSRVPVEIIFDQGFGELFVIRVAGNVVASSQIGSVEFAAVQFGVKLVVVLGHTRCGAIQATLAELAQPTQNQSRNLRSIVDRIRPSVAGLLETELRHNPVRLAEHAIRSNVRVSANYVRHGSEIVERLTEQAGLLIVGAEYSLETGVVDFFDGLPFGYENQEPHAV